MKKFIRAAWLPLLYFIISSFTIYDFQTVQAEDHTYACIRSENVYLYSGENEDGIFILPYSYYVKIVSYGVKYTYVEYLTDGTQTRKVTGYCKTNELTFVDYIPQCPYLYYTIDVTYTIGEDVAFNNALTGMTVTCAYYGDYLVGSKVYCYVLRSDTFGYIPKPEMNYPLNDEYESRYITTDTVSEATQADSPSAAQIAILILLCLLIPVLAALILRSSKKLPYDPDE